MRTASTLVAGLMVVALGAGARADDGVPAPPPPGATVVAPVLLAPPPAPPPRRLEVGLAFLPMGVGKITAPVGSKEVTGGASFAYGVGLSATYKLIAGLGVGFAPQAIFNVIYKVNPSQLMSPGAATEYDIMARVAYTLPIVETIAVYAEALPGYSVISIPGASPAKGAVLGFGGGVAMDLGDRAFVNLGAGYQLGYQTVSQVDMTLDNRTRYLRVVLGGGVRL